MTTGFVDHTRGGRGLLYDPAVTGDVPVHVVAETSLQLVGEPVDHALVGSHVAIVLDGEDDPILLLTAASNGQSLDVVTVRSSFEFRRESDHVFKADLRTEPQLTVHPFLMSYFCHSLTS